MFGLNKIALYFIIATFLTGALGSAYYLWKKSIEHAALLEFNRAQMEQTVKDQQKFIEQQQQIADQTRAAVQQMQNNNIKLQNKIGGINDFLNTATDKSSSDVLKQTFIKLRELQQGDSTVNSTTTTTTTIDNHMHKLPKIVGNTK